MSLPNNSNGGFDIPVFIPGDKGPSPFSAGTMNIFSRAVSSLLGMKVVRGDTDRVFVSEGNVVVQLSKKAEASSGGSPERFIVKSIQADYLTCRTWDGTTQGLVDVLIAKPPLLRNKTPAKFADTYGATAITITVAYTYAATFVRRTAVASVYPTGLGATYEDEIQDVDPPYNIYENVTDSVYLYPEIWAVKTGKKTGVVVSGSDVDYLDLNLDGRVWATIAVNPAP